MRKQNQLRGEIRHRKRRAGRRLCCAAPALIVARRLMRRVTARRIVGTPPSFSLIPNSEAHGRAVARTVQPLVVHSDSGGGRE
jgi:hypothetical protein